MYLFNQEYTYYLLNYIDLYFYHRLVPAAIICTFTFVGSSINLVEFNGPIN